MQKNDKIKLKNLFDVFFIVHPIIPPTVVPIVPKNNPKIVVFIIFSINQAFFNLYFHNIFLLQFSEKEGAMHPLY